MSAKLKKKLKISLISPTNKQRKPIDDKAAMIIAAAGLGLRAGHVHKPFVSLCKDGSTSVDMILDLAAELAFLESVVVVMPDEMSWSIPERYSGRLKIVRRSGGSSRQSSVFNGLKELSKLGRHTYVFVHDGARPFASKLLFERLWHRITSSKATGVIPGVSVVDAVKATDGVVVHRTIEKASLRLAQTPQIFCFETLMSCHDRFSGENFSDDASLLEETGHVVEVVEGEGSNFKLTTESDIALAKLILNSSISPP